MPIKQKPRKIRIAGKSKPIVEAKPSATVKSAPRVEASRIQHAISQTYGGVSPVLTTRKSKTPLRTNDFGTSPELVMSERDNALLNGLKAQYKKRQFARGNADTGILNRAIRKGLLRHVGGDPTHQDAMLQFA